MPVRPKTTKRSSRGDSIPITARINAKNDQACVSDEALDEVFVLKYPNGSPIAVLDTAGAAVDSQNFNP